MAGKVAMIKAMAAPPARESFVIFIVVSIFRERGNPLFSLRIKIGACDYSVMDA
jgi:hypothetical protein